MATPFQDPLTAVRIRRLRRSLVCSVVVPHLIVITLSFGYRVLPLLEVIPLTGEVQLFDFHI